MLGLPGNLKQHEYAKKKKKKIGGVWLAGDFKVHVAAAASLIFGVPIVEARTFFFFFLHTPL